MVGIFSLMKQGKMKRCLWRYFHTAQQSSGPVSHDSRVSVRQRQAASTAVLLGFLAEDQLCVVAAWLSYWSWNNWGHCWFGDLNSMHHNTVWAHTGSACLGDKFTPSLHAQLKTIFANCIKERQHQVFQPQKNVGYSVTCGGPGLCSGPQTFMEIFHTSRRYLCPQKMKAFRVILVMTA